MAAKFNILFTAHCYRPQCANAYCDVAAVHQQLGNRLRRNRPIGTGAGDFGYVIRYVRPGPHHQGLRPEHRKTGARLRRKEGGDVAAVQSTIGQPASPESTDRHGGREPSLRDPSCWSGPPSPRATPRTRKTGARLRRKKGGDVTAVQSTIGQPGFARNRLIGTGAGDFRYVIRYVGRGPHHQGLRPVHEGGVPGFAGKKVGMWAPYSNNWATGKRALWSQRALRAPFGGALPGTEICRTPT